MTQPPGEAELAAHEDATGDQVEEAVTAALAAGATAATVAALLPAVRRILQPAVSVGYILGYLSAQPPGGKQGRRAGVRSQIAAVRASRAADVTGIIRDALNGALGDLASGADPHEVAGRLARRLRSIAVTLTTEAVSAGIEAAAKAGKAVGLMWVTEADPCPACKTLAGTVVPIGQGWRPPDGSSWQRFKGRPPLHPNCRCRPRPVWGTQPRSPERALRRGARRRAGRRTTTTRR